MRPPQKLTLKALSLRSSSWSMRPWLALTHAGMDFKTETVSLPHMMTTSTDSPSSSNVLTLEERRKLGSVRGLFPVLHIQQDTDDDEPTKQDAKDTETTGGGTTTTTSIHESLAICEYVADCCPEAHLWPSDTVDRARARALCCEMMTGFLSLRQECSCALMARVPPSGGFTPAPATIQDIDRVLEIWTECLNRSGGPYLFGAHFGIVDCMYYPVVTRFQTYGIAFPTEQIMAYVEAVERTPAVQQLLALAKTQPAIPSYDEYIRTLGGDPESLLS